MANTVYHTVILGAGASGLFCAGSFNRPKLIIDHNSKPGVKLAVSGGGACNFTNRSVSFKDYLCQNKHFCKNALAAFGPEDFLQLLDEQRIAWREKENGKLFGQKAGEIVALLQERAQRAHTQFWLGTQLLGLRFETDHFVVDTSRGPVQAANVVVATGGLSFPALGASNFAAQAAQKFGLNVVEQHPALVGLRFEKQRAATLKELAGSSVRARIQTGDFETEDDLLFTHDGISGPAALQASLFWTEGQSVTLHVSPQTDWEAFFRANKHSTRSFSTLAGQLLPPRMAKALLHGVDRDPANASKEQLQAAARALGALRFIPASTAGYTKAEVTSGGVDTRELNPSTCQTRKHPGLFFIGEAVDVTGRLGGYNLQWAWSSAYAAAQALDKR